MLIMLIVAWTILGAMFYNTDDIKSKKKLYLYQFLSGPIIWFFEIGRFILNGMYDSLFKPFNDWLRK